MIRETHMSRENLLQNFSGHVCLSLSYHICILPPPFSCQLLKQQKSITVYTNEILS